MRQIYQCELCGSAFVGYPGDCGCPPFLTVAELVNAYNQIYAAIGTELKVSEACRKQREEARKELAELRNYARAVVEAYMTNNESIVEAAIENLKRAASNTTY
jgi:protoheme ferro-lyase